MKINQLNTETRTANVLTSALVELSEKEIRFIVGANRRIKSIQERIFSLNGVSEEVIELVNEMSILNFKLNQILVPQLEEALLVIDNQFLSEFDPYQEEREGVAVPNPEDYIDSSYKSKRKY